MSLNRLQIRSGKRGSGTPVSEYITRTGRWSESEKRYDIVHSSFGNLPEWCGGDPYVFWAAADKYERKNGAVFREEILTLPRGLSVSEQIRRVEAFIRQSLPGKPYQYAIHCPIASDGEEQPHAHVMYSDRVLDEHVREPAQFFARYSSSNPASGGCRKDSGGLTPRQLIEKLEARTRAWDELQS